MSKVHELKCWPMFYRAVKNWNKLFEIRKNDRGYNVGDILHLREFHETTGYTGDSIHRKITYIANFPEGLRDGYICMVIGAVDGSLSLEELIAEIERRKEAASIPVRGDVFFAAQAAAFEWLLDWIKERQC